ncbi:ABC transporter permease [Rummeliibacillus pycnus]|uniref:ABC transporter permease n=1 Tax=Rummeliibacillus pycnus TaxID=101070 RepID=UPI0037CBCBDA
MVNRDNKFQIVGCQYKEEEPVIYQKKKILHKPPILSIIILAIIVIGCLGAKLFITQVPSHMYLDHISNAPNRQFFFGTDNLGRDIFSMIWYGGRISLFIGIIATTISTIIAIVYGTISGTTVTWIDNMMMRLTEILLSLPNILMIIFVQAIMGKQTVMSIALTIGITSWMSMAKIIRTEVRQIRNSGYVMASRCMGGSFLYILRKHLAPNFIAAIMFMIVMNISMAIAAESTLSFLGLGLPTDIISWGSLLSLAPNALLTKEWWIILIPGLFLIVTLLCITNIGNYIRSEANKKQSNL